MMRKVWIEAALNGAWGRALQPGIPDTVDAIIDEGVACAKAGAAIVHMHAYDSGGPQTFDWQVYARIIEGIRKQADMLVYPSYPALMASGIGEGWVNPERRFDHIEALAARGLLDFAVIDPGSVNFTQVGTTTGTRPASTYVNPEAQARDALAFAARHGLPPNFATVPDVQVSRFRFFMEEFRSRRCSGGRSGLTMNRALRGRARRWPARPGRSLRSTA